MIDCTEKSFYASDSSLTNISFIFNITVIINITLRNKCLFKKYAFINVLHFFIAVCSKSHFCLINFIFKIYNQNVVLMATKAETYKY